MNSITLLEVAICSSTVLSSLGIAGFSFARSSAYKKGQELADSAKNMWLNRIDSIESDVASRVATERESILKSLEEKQKELDLAREELKRMQVSLAVDLQEAETMQRNLELGDELLQKRMKNLDKEVSAAAISIANEQVLSIKKDLNALKSKFKEIMKQDDVTWIKAGDTLRKWLPNREKLDIISVRDIIFSLMTPDNDYRVKIEFGSIAEIFIITSHDPRVIEKKLEFIFSEWRKQGNIYPAPDARGNVSVVNYKIDVFYRKKTNILSPSAREENYNQWLASLKKLEETVDVIIEKKEELTLEKK